MPTVEQIRAHYSRYYLTRMVDQSVTERLVTLHAPVVTWLLAQLSNSVKPKVLDYGFGSGALLIQMAQQNADVYGCDVSTQNVAQLAGFLSARGIASSLVDLSAGDFSSLREVQFDVITMLQVVEHLVNPLQQLRELASTQRVGGLLYIECPNDDATLAVVKGLARFMPGRRVFWRSLKNPEHVHGFNRRSLTRMLQEAGYSVILCDDYAYRDGFHQVEAEVWWPRLTENPRRWSLYGLSRSAIPLMDRVFSDLLGAGSGLFALAKKVDRTSR